MATTRLDRLFLLLDTGSTPVTRKAAAQQLGEVQKLHPQDLHNLLFKVHVYLRSRTWDTRIAAGQAIEAISRNVPQWQPVVPVVKVEDDAGESSASTLPKDSLNFAKFDINRVLQKGTSLLGSSGMEYEQELEETGIDPKQRLAKQRKLLQKKLGLDVGGVLGMDTNDLFDDDDLEVKDEPQKRNQFLTVPQTAAEIMEQEMDHLMPGLSSRERNRAKRKARILAKQRSKDHPDSISSSFEGSFDEPPGKRAKTSTLSKQASVNERTSDTSQDSSVFIEAPGDWPFMAFSEQLCNDLFHQSWEVRHGAATGIRELVKTHGKSGGKSLEYQVSQQDELNQAWLEDIALRLLCVLALDRFGDFVSDEVVAPVRETCAQALGVVLHHMTEESVHGVLSILLQLFNQQQWEVRHGGLIGLKYLLAVRKEMTSSLLPSVLQCIIDGLQDCNDDVMSVAAAALNPVADTLVRICPDQVPVILRTLWDTLLDLDDLTASTNSIMVLLSSLLSYPMVHQKCFHTQSLGELIPRLWPFLSHTILSVRKAALQTLLTLLKADTYEVPVGTWLPVILQDAMRHIFQRCLVETTSDTLDLIQEVWDAILQKAVLQNILQATIPWYSAWLSLCMQSSKLPLDSNLLINSTYRNKTANKSPKGQQQVKEKCQEFLGGATSIADDNAEHDLAVVQARTRATRLIGRLSARLTSEMVHLPDLPLDGNAASSICQLLEHYLSSNSAVLRMVVGMIIEEWSVQDESCKCTESVKLKLMEMLNNNVYFEEVSSSFMRMQTECKALVTMWIEARPDLRNNSFPNMFTVDQAIPFADSIYGMLGQSRMHPKMKDSLTQKCQKVQAVGAEVRKEQQVLTVRVQCCLAAAAVSLKFLPEKLNPIIKPLMEAIKKEWNPLIQSRAATALAKLLEQCISRTPCPNPKIIKNLCSFLCCDSTQTPNVVTPINPLEMQMTCSGSSSSRPTTPINTPLVMEAAVCGKTYGILTLAKQQQAAALSAVSRRAAFAKSRSKHSNTSQNSSVETSVEIPNFSDIMSEAKEQEKLQRRGAEFAVGSLALHFGDRLFVVLDKLWMTITSVLQTNIKPHKFDATFYEDKNDLAQEIVNSFQVLEVISPNTHQNLNPQLESLLPYIIACLSYPYTAVRHLASRCLGVLSKVSTVACMNKILEDVKPMLDAADNEIKRQGAIEALANVIDLLGIDLVPYIVLLVVPVLGRMSDQVECVRLMATQCFATLIRLMPLEAGIPDPPSMTATLIEQKVRERCFLEQLLDSSKLENYRVPVAIKAELRKYQQDGINWLAFLNKYKLHGILCDDMGLGKTLMSLCIIAGDHFLRQKEYKASQNPACARLPSIVICPTTLTGHWVYEVEKFCAKEHLHPLHYTGPPNERIRLRSKMKRCNLVVVSYDILRNDIDFFGDIKWNYCILDEGHIIKNGKTKIAKSIKQLIANHRLILSGTPIQNNVLELWSLFDFLMPGFLGTEKQFIARYAKPILQSKDAKSSTKEQEAGALAMEALHRQVLPFLLRRLKEDVLDDLPPKIIQDYYCELSPLQVQLYEDFAKSRAKRGVEDAVHSNEGENKQRIPQKGSTHIFQALQYLRKVCNHPLLVVNQKHPQYDNITRQLKEQNSSLNDIQHAPKLTALKQLLLDCGIGGNDEDNQDEIGGAVVCQHRVLLFCQLKSMLDIVEKDLLKSHLPKVTYRRLDGSVPAGSRHDIVNRFNNDPSIDILLLTTHVGGLGLNLTGADTVIFVEHDWNPTKDLQAMDRAHRIGQKKVVNVYRLITKGTLEEKIMGLQKFKMNIANTVISQDNSALQSMATEQLLDLFSLDKGNQSSIDQTEEKDTPQSMKAVMSNLGELWDDKQYENEYDLSSFMQSLT
ncbi:TATA-binding protein-associated factor 172-like [Anneissia japonica]|uniref:TATA-binding protein-associated factor 172-like n=1 Tax=Anneissia japonica TaxID=1529436 RepID=UPI0014256546|nr:TATA-binding protein-associated factor 172-like [Anneissia japonica]